MSLLNNRYQIIRELGAGGFGNTYLAEDTQMPSRRCCVIKQLKPITYNPEVHQLIQERFAREAAVLEKLGEHSSQIPRLYAYFSERNQFYLIQEWIEGTTLSKKVQEFGVLRETEVREILVSLLQVLDFVHRQGIVHRDIKPDNIILRSSDGKPVLIDFGAVRETVATQLNSQGQSTASIIIGTPGFMPSEQAAGRPVYSSDLYSLGLTAIYLLTGKVPQQLATDPVTGEIIWDKQGISASLASVLDKAARSHPRDRFPTAQAMLESLQTDSVPHLEPTVPFVPQGGEIPPTIPSLPRQELLPTSPVTPAYNTAPPASGNKSNAIILGSLIASGFIGAAVVVGLMFKQYESSKPVTAVSPVSSASPATVAVSPTHSQSVTSSSPAIVTVSPTQPQPVASPSTTPVAVSPPSPESSTFSPPPELNNEDLPFFMVRRVTEADLAGKSQWELDVMRNEIYARYGRRFQRNDLQAYFNQQSWYDPQYAADEFPESLLTPIQKRNALFIARYQKSQ